MAEHGPARGSHQGDHDVDAQVFFLPFAVPEPFELPGFPGIDSGLLARRLPDFLHQVLNGGGPGPVGMLEIHSPPGDGPPRWVTLPETPDSDEIFEMLGSTRGARAVVTGSLGCSDAGLQLDLTVHWAPGAAPHGGEGGFVHGLRGVVSLDAPARGMSRLARHLAHVIGLGFEEPASNVLTDVPQAFFKFLEGLEGAAVLSAVPGLEDGRSGEQLVGAFADALTLDPCFGMALRTAAMTFFVAMEDGRVGEDACYRLVDRCFATQPTDGEGCVAIAEQLAMAGDEERAIRWLEHAVRLDPPAPRALENLGVMIANRGDLAAAKELWLRGLEQDGHPDFFAHLARLAFSQGRPEDAWDRLRRGLARKFERAVRAAEWVEPSRPGILLRYLAEHLEDESAPEDVSAALVELAGLLTQPHEQVDLGLCLYRVGRADLAEEELQTGLRGPIPPALRDAGMTALLAIQIPDFDRRFTKMCEAARKGRDPRGALVDLQAVLDRQPQYWPALYWIGVALRRLGHEDQALDVQHEVLGLRPGQTEALVEMAAMFDRRGNPKRALECIDDALGSDAESASLHAARAAYLERLGRRREARQSLGRALELSPGDAELLRRRARLRRD